VGADTVGNLLREEGFSLQGNSRVLEGADHPDRDAQFRYITTRSRPTRRAGIRWPAWTRRSPAVGLDGHRAGGGSLLNGHAPRR
jgi:hypothetical protein